MSIKRSVELLLSLLPDHPEIPGWVSDYVELVECENSSSSIEKKIVTQSYLDFLDEQIVLQSRGPDWNQFLQQRRDAIAPYLDKEITFLSIDGHDENHVSIYLDESAKVILNVERE